MTRPERRPTAKGRPAVTRPAGYQWLLAQMMEQHGMHATVNLGPLLAERGVVLSDAQVYRLIHYIPERLSLKTLAALCDIFGCTPNDLVVPLVEGAQRTKRAKTTKRRGDVIDAEPAPAELPESFTPVRADLRPTRKRP
jgi:DNA-binding Xre family transcriptional regulator